MGDWREKEPRNVVIPNASLVEDVEKVLPVYGNLDTFSAISCRICAVGAQVGIVKLKKVQQMRSEVTGNKDWK